MIFDATFQSLMLRHSMQEEAKNPPTRTVLILRGISGAGKSTFASLIAEPKVVCTADDHFEVDGKYQFDDSQLGVAHTKCQEKFLDALKNPKILNIVVANTNTDPSHFEFYEEQARVFGIRVVYAILEKRHDNANVHDVPQDVLDKQHDELSRSVKLR